MFWVAQSPGTGGVSYSGPAGSIKGLLPCLSSGISIEFSLLGESLIFLGGHDIVYPLEGIGSRGTVSSFANAGSARRAGAKEQGIFKNPRRRLHKKDKGCQGVSGRFGRLCCPIRRLAPN
jgi:hypothetical protein